MMKHQPQKLEKFPRRVLSLCVRATSGAIALVMLVSTTMASNTFSGSELRKIHPTDLLKALSVLEPAIASFDRMQANGSDPNALPSSIVLRGPNSFPLQLDAVSEMPIIIVDEHVESLLRLKDFDIRRVESISIIKNASATSLYGVQASHGVILIKTISPQGDGINLTYSFDGSFNRADVSSFDMMNGDQKLDWEKKLGLYDGQMELYDSRKEYVSKHGSTDWISMPLRTKFNQQHRLMVEGGDKNFRYRGEIYFQPSGGGVLKGSGRKSHGASAYVGYITDKVSVSNELRVDFVTADYSKYGCMTDWMGMNPYFAATDVRGVPYDSVGQQTFSAQASPLYEASLKSFSQNKMQRIINSFDIKWNISDEFSVGGSFTLTRDQEKLSTYISPMSRFFADYAIDDADQVGSYSIDRGHSNIYQEGLWGAYNFNCGLHKLTAKVGFEAFASTNSAIGIKGVGMSSNNMDFISFAKRYPVGQRAMGHEFYERMLSAYANVSWIYADRLYVDGSVRFDKSSMLAPQKRTASSYGLNVAYDLKKIAALSYSSFFKSLSVSAGVGNTAGYNFDYAAANSMYNYLFDSPYLSGAGQVSDGYDIGLVSLVRVGPANPFLKWCTNFNYNVGLKTSFAGIIDLGVEYYNTLTSNIITLDKKSVSFGFGFNYGNQGKIRNSGVEVNLRGVVLDRKNGVKLSLSTSAVANKNKILASSRYTNDAYNSQMYTAYSQIVNGNSIDGIYAMVSSGIDPDTGIETFKSDKMEYMGSMTPKLNGVAALNAEWRGIELDVAMQYSLGGKFYDYSQQVFVDIASPRTNVPVAAEQKWTLGAKNAKYQGLSSTYAPSSRFVSTLNSLSLATVRLGYNFPQSIARKVAMQRLRIALTCNDVAYSSSVKNIRGFIYPYASSYTLSLQATF